MHNDKTTLRDLSFLGGAGSLFPLLDHTTTQMGKEELRKLILDPPDSFESLVAMQESIKFFTLNPQVWPATVSNGTFVMLDKFFESADGAATPGGFGALFGGLFQRVLNRNEYSFTRFSVSHLSDFLKGCRELERMLDSPGIPSRLRATLELIKADLDTHRLTAPLTAVNNDTAYNEIVRLSFAARREMKTLVYRLMNHYALLDAWRSLALATLAHKWIFPELLPSFPLTLDGEQMFHPLLKAPVPYDLSLHRDQNFLLLTGANMSGKTTLMRTVGVCALMAHLGMGVPATVFRCSFLQGIITNMHVEDNIVEGESYFFAEVKRMKQTALKLAEPLPHLVLMDELFKGTNVHDAFECTRAVVEGLLNHHRHLMVLSTHLYEVAQQFRDRKEMTFAYFVTNMTAEGSYSFTYRLKPGISDDRIGYRILKQEGVLDLLGSGKN